MIKRYPEYTERELTFIGEMPKQWDTVRCAHLFEVKNITNTSGEINLSVYRDYGVIKRDSRDDNYNRVPEDTSNYKLVEHGDFVFNKMKCWQGSLGVSEYRGIVSPAYTVCSPKKPFHGKYLHYLLRSRPYVQELKRLSYGVRIGQWELRFKDFKDVVVPYPSVSEQAQIANFLDLKTQQTDELIRAKERKIELLGEYRASLIHEAVAKGLDPNAEMKTSGVECIGALHSHWRMKRLKYVAESIKNGTTATQIQSGQTAYPVTRIETISKGKINFRKVGYVNHWDGIENHRLQLGDILLSHINSLAIVGNCAMLENPACLYHGMNLLRIRPLSSIDHRFLLYWLKCRSINQLIKSFAKFAIGQVSVSITNLKEIPVGCPPLIEQTQIADYLDRKTRQIDELRSTEEQSIKLLKEYRQSLISAVVTGKIDVRGEV